MKLYQVWSTAKEFDGCKNVGFAWFFNGQRPEHRPNAELIENYNAKAHGIHYAEEYIEQLFTLEEAQQLKNYLHHEYRDANTGPATIEEVQFPVANNILGGGSIPVGGDCDFYMLDRTPGYPLPFKAWGYFDLRQHL